MKNDAKKQKTILFQTQLRARRTQGKTSKKMEIFHDFMTSAIKGGWVGGCLGWVGVWGYRLQ